MSLYGALWRCLPGPLPVRLVLAALLALAAVAALFHWVFPALAPSVPWNDSTVGAAAPARSTAPAPASSS